ncbi:hypothetical protein KAW48_01700 [candidate division WOR-3 bacterium]|nr:hypothetical protein [candidate division WOR-3 bacterium]
MILLALIMVEEDIFEPELPLPEIKPTLAWIYRMDVNRIKVGVNRDRYHLLSAKFGCFRICSIKERDFAEHYSLSSSVQSVSYRIHLDHQNWDRKRVTQVEGWKWIYYDSNLLLGWVDGVHYEDSLLWAWGVRYYSSFPSISVGGWMNYKDTPDFGVILQYSGFRIEYGKERRCAGYIGSLGDIKVGRFRDWFPTTFFPLKDQYPRVLAYYGARIHLSMLEITAGRRDYYISESDTLQWVEGNCYFSTIRMEGRRFGFLVTYQQEGIVKGYGSAYLSGNVGWLGYGFSLTGFSHPKRYTTGSISLWCETEISPFASIRNISYSREEDLLNPVYYIGVHCVY